MMKQGSQEDVTTVSILTDYIYINLLLQMKANKYICWNSIINYIHKMLTDIEEK